MENKKDLEIKKDFRGISTLSALGLIFITLKLIGEISWKWVWVLVPFWIEISAFLFWLVLVIIVKRWG